MTNSVRDAAGSKCQVSARSFSSVLSGGVPIGGATVVTFKFPLLRRGVSFIKHGPVWRRGGDSNFEDYSLVVEQLIAEYGRNQGNAIIIVPRPSPDTLDAELGCLTNLGFTVGGINRDPNRYIVNASLAEEEQLRSVGQKWRYNLRKGLKRQLEVVVASDIKHFNAFRKLHAEMVSRKSFVNNDPLAALPLLNAAPDSLRPVYFMLKSDGEPVAGAVVIICGDLAFYVFGASSKSALSLNAGYVLQWSILKHLRDRKVRWYDLGGEAGSGGLQQFKTGLTGKSGVVLNTPGELRYSVDAGAEMAYRTISAIRDGVRRVRSVLKQ